MKTQDHRFARRLRRQLAILGFALTTLVGATAALGAAPATQSASPEHVIRSTLDDAFTVLKREDLKAPDRRGERIAKLHEATDDVFDWQRMAEESLGDRWDELPPAKRERFSRIFGKILADQYMRDIDRFRGTERMDVVGQEGADGRTVVNTLLITPGTERIPIDYGMFQKNGEWRVLDISIEGVSLVRHFERTFHRFLRKRSFDDLIEHLEGQLPASGRGEVGPPPT